MSEPQTSRELASRARHAILATLARAPLGHPFASLVAIACDERGRPLLLLSSLADHTKNLGVAPSPTERSRTCARATWLPTRKPRSGRRFAILRSTASSPRRSASSGDRHGDGGNHGLEATQFPPMRAVADKVEGGMKLTLSAQEPTDARAIQAKARERAKAMTESCDRH